MPLPELPDGAWARIELAKLEAARTLQGWLKKLRSERLEPSNEQRLLAAHALEDLLKGMAAAPSGGNEAEKAKSYRLLAGLLKGINKPVTEEDVTNDFQLRLAIHYAEYVDTIFSAWLDELEAAGVQPLSVVNEVAQTITATTIPNWLNAGGKPEYKDQFVEIAFKTMKTSPRYRELLENVAEDKSRHTVILPLLPPEEQVRISNAVVAAKGKVESARTHLRRKVEAESALESLALDEPAEKRSLLEHIRDTSSEQAEVCVGLAAGELFDLYASKYWHLFRPHAKKFAVLLTAMGDQVETDLACPELSEAIQETIRRKCNEWEHETVDKGNQSTQRLMYAEETKSAIAAFKLHSARDPSGQRAYLEELASRLTDLHLGQLVAQVNSENTYEQFLSSSRLAETFIQEAISFLAQEDREIALQFVDAQICHAQAEAAAATRGESGGASESARADENTAPPRKGKRGRPTAIADELKIKALAVEGGKARAQILYGTLYPSTQQVKNVPNILKHFTGKKTKKPKAEEA